MYNIGYVGFSEVMIRELEKCPFYSLQFVACEEERQTNKYVAASDNAKCRRYSIRNDKDLMDILLTKEKNIDFIIIYNTGIIIHKELLDICDFFNFHGGNLFTNKGAHATVWSILLDEKESSLSLHKIDSNIDEGLMIDSYNVKINSLDTQTDLIKNMETGIPKLLKSLNEFIDGNITPIPVPKGGYRRKLRENDYTIDPDHDSQRTIICKIKSQLNYNGAIYNRNGNNFRIDNWKIINDEKEVENLDDGFYLKNQSIFIFVKHR